jgi:hypothetical protein
MAQDEQCTDDAPVITDATVADIAEETSTDTRTVIRRIAKLPVKGKPGQRIDRALAARGLAPATNVRPLFRRAGGDTEPPRAA